MRISFVEIQNFRKLKSCRVDFDDNQTILVGANNSGKTSFVSALRGFLDTNGRKEISTADITLSNWDRVNEIGRRWSSESASSIDGEAESEWLSIVPTLDIWLQIGESDIHRIIDLIPTLSWTTNSLLGVRMVFYPKNLENLYKNFRQLYLQAREVEQKSELDQGAELEQENGGSDRKRTLWPLSLMDYLDRRIKTDFGIQSYILDSEKYVDPVGGVLQPQTLSSVKTPCGSEPFKNIIKVSVVTAQRGLSDSNIEADVEGGSKRPRQLSAQVRKYLSNLLDPEKEMTVEDLSALRAIGDAQEVFDKQLNESFKTPLSELREINYPGFSDPDITLSSRLTSHNALNHSVGLKFQVLGSALTHLPETYNGLGYQNLISMLFHLIQDRDEWMRVGKSVSANLGDMSVEPLHLVLLEEPEAHLHVQAQQVFIRKAYDVLTKNLQNGFNTQLVVSTHSSSIAHELEFSCLRYFRRMPISPINNIPISDVVNLSETFGSEYETAKFITRYIRSTHCDLFFADAVILVEGSVERMLVPHFIRNNFEQLYRNYITVLEIGGAHAHRLRPLIEKLNLTCLIITDIDSIDADNKKILPKRNEGYRTGNATLKTWLPANEELDELLDLVDDAKIGNAGTIRVAYQQPVMCGDEEVIFYTFEDALAFSNKEIMLGYEGATGLLKKLQEALGEIDATLSMEEMFEALKKGDKAKLALDLLFLTDPEQLAPPEYIAEGLNWLQSQLEGRVLATVDVVVEGE